jgi:DNA-binding response OmpR family regulator
VSFTPSQTKARILLVDDERDITSILAQGLELHGFKIDSYNDAKTVLDNFRPEQYDQIILDIRMPGMNGFDLARQIWQVDPAAQICFLSAFEIFEDEASKVFRDFNTKCFIKKPITTKNLADHIESLHLKTRD